MLGQHLGSAEQCSEIPFPGLRAFRIGHRCDDRAAAFQIHRRPRKQRARFIALSRRQHQDQRVSRPQLGIANEKSTAFQDIRKRLETLLVQPAGTRQGMPSQPIPRAQEQHATISRQTDAGVGQGMAKGFERSTCLIS